MTILQPAKAGDSGDTRVIRLDGIGDLTTVTSVVAFVKHNRTKVALTASVLDATACTITVDLGDAAAGGNPAGWLAARPDVGIWNIEYQLTMLDGSIITWPNEDYDTIEVAADLDPA